MELEEILLKIYPIEAKLQILHSCYVEYKSYMNFYSKIENVDKEQIADLDNVKDKLKEVNKKIFIYKDKISNIDIKISDIGYNDIITQDNYQDLVDWQDEKKKRQSDKVQIFYEAKKKEVNKQKIFVKIFEKLSIFFFIISLFSLVIRNFVLHDLFNTFSSNFSMLAVLLIMITAVSTYQYKNNKKKLENIEIEYKNNSNIIRLIDVSTNNMLQQSNCNDINEFEEKIKPNLEKFEKICELQKEKSKVKAELQNFHKQKEKLNKIIYTAFSALGVKIDYLNLDECLANFKREYENYVEFKEEYESFSEDYKRLYTEYKNLNKQCENIYLSKFEVESCE